MLRGSAFAATLVLAAADYARTACFQRKQSQLHRRAQWLRRWSVVTARVIGLRVHCRGEPPASGMIVSNHLSYLDIIALSALTPCLFVAKQEIASWPILGFFARMAGTIFVDRTRRTAVRQANADMEAALSARAVVVIFPEGTSSDGRTVLPFKSSLLEPILRTRCQVAPAGIAYDVDGGCVAEEVCYWRDMTLLPHLLNLLRKRSITARITFGVSSEGAAFRKALAATLRKEIEALRGM